MEPQTKRMLTATVLCLIVLIGWMKMQEILYPASPRTQPTTQVVGKDTPGSTAESGEGPSADPGDRPSGPRPAAAEDPKPPAAESTSGIRVARVEPAGPMVLGDDRWANGRYEFSAVVSPVGAGVDSVHLAGHRNHVPKNRKNPEHDPYNLLESVELDDSGRMDRSFVLQEIWFAEEDFRLPIRDAVWTVEEPSDGEKTVLSLTIQKGGRDILRLTRTYRLPRESYHLQISTEVKNLSTGPRRVRLVEGGPVGIKQEDIRFDGRRVVSAVIQTQNDVVDDGENESHAEVAKAENASIELGYSRDQERLFWTALGNKFFTCIVCPQPLDPEKHRYPGFFKKVLARARAKKNDSGDDLTFEQVFVFKDAIAADDAIVYESEVFCGPKSHALFNGEQGLAVARERDYEIAGNPDRSACAPDSLSSLMLWLLTSIQSVVRNYGVAIIILVIIVRLVLHPITKRGQINMTKMQRDMAKIKPKLEAIQAQYKNDRQKLNEETQKLYREEGVNPAGSIMGCLPMLLQTPIWIALWTTLNTNVDMRQQPFFGYIQDLSSPDALIPFDSVYSIPLLSAMMGPVSSFNVLPLLMAGIMYAQQKIMQKMSKPDNPPAPKLDKDGKPLPDTMAQQQKIMSFMMLFFGFLFYNFPSGLCLYILSSSLLGLGEQIYIKKHIREEEAKGALEKAKKDARGEKSAGWLKTKIDQAQKLAEQQRLAQAKAGSARSGKKRKKKY